MIIHIPEVLTSEELSYVRSVFAKAQFVDGKVTAGEQSMQVKKNVQIDQSSPESKELGEIVLKALGVILFLILRLCLIVWCPLYLTDMIRGWSSPIMLIMHFALFLGQICVFVQMYHRLCF